MLKIKYIKLILNFFYGGITPIIFNLKKLHMKNYNFKNKKLQITL